MRRILSFIALAIICPIVFLNCASTPSPEEIMANHKKGMKQAVYSWIKEQFLYCNTIKGYYRGEPDIEYDDIIFYIPKFDCLLSDINSQGLFYKAVDCVFNAEDNFDDFFDAFQYVTIYSTHGNYIPKENKDFIVTVKIILENESGEQFSINNEELHINSKDIYCDVSEKTQGSNTYLYKVENKNPYSLPIWNKIIKKTDFIEINSNIPKLEKNKIYFSKTITDFKTSQRTVMWRNFIESINNYYQIKIDSDIITILSEYNWVEREPSIIYCDDNRQWDYKRQILVGKEQNMYLIQGEGMILVKDDAKVIHFSGTKQYETFQDGKYEINQYAIDSKKEIILVATGKKQSVRLTNGNLIAIPIYKSHILKPNGPLSSLSNKEIPAYTKIVWDNSDWLEKPKK